MKHRFLNQVEQGLKPLEARQNLGELAQARVGDRVIWNDRVETRIKAIRRYRSFEVMLALEKPEDFYPGATREVMLSILRDIYPTDSARGVLCFELELIN